METTKNQTSEDLRIKDNSEAHKDREYIELEMQGYQEHLEFQEWKRNKERISEADKFLKGLVFEPDKPKINDLDALKQSWACFSSKKIYLESRRKDIDKDIDGVNFVLTTISAVIQDMEDMPF